MSRRSSGEGERELAALVRRVEAWRGRRRARCRMPEALWSEAVGLAGRLGTSVVSRAARLDYYSLKGRVLAEAVAATSGVRFVELSAPAALERTEPACEVELVRADGLRLVIRWPGSSDLLAVARAFWENRP